MRKTGLGTKRPARRGPTTPGLISPPFSTMFTLPNGLEVILAPIPDSPIVSSWVWYRTGSVHEHPGITGAAHWLEHMLFKGSRRFGVGEVDRAIVGVGGNLNAFTDLDFTAYISVVPKYAVDLPLTIEADRITGATIPVEELDKERNVVLSEREMNENTPEFRIEEELYSLAYRVHPYRWNTLGYAADIRGMDRTKLVEFYQTYYRPSRATLVVAGGFDPTAIRHRIETLFSPIEDTPSPVPVLPEEPPQSADRVATLHGPGSSSLVRIAWHAPPVGHADAASALLLSAVLGGETELFTPGYTWGQSREHPSSLLYRTLVDTDLAISTGCEWQPSIYPGLFSLRARAAEDVPLERLESAMTNLVEKVRRNGVASSELESARQRFRVNAGTVWSGTTLAAFRLGYFRSLGSIALEQNLFQRTQSLRIQEVNAFARGLFDSPRTMVRFVPEGT